MTRWTNNDMPHTHEPFDGHPLGGCRGIITALVVYGIVIIIAGIVYWWVWA